MPSALPEWMPIVAERMRGGDPYPRAYVEPELTQAVDLCDARGRLNPAAVGWSRRPLVRGNLRGPWLRRKRWNFWNWISPEFVFSVTLADIDYAAFCQMTFTDFASGRMLEARVAARPGSLALPETVEQPIGFHRGGVEYRNETHGGDWTVAFHGKAKSGEAVVAEFVVHRPPGHESLNLVVPWRSDRFQLNAKHNALPCTGAVTVAGRRYAMEPASCFAVQDFGRGVWPYRAFWNWGVATGVQDGRLIGVNVGGKWTTGTGSNENAICLDGRLHKVMEDLVWRYEPRDWRQPWHVRATHSGAIDLTLTPVAAHTPTLDLGVLRSGGVCAFGRWQGTIRVDGAEVPIRDLMGWAEEFSHRW